ncbi:large ribosomal subunit protein uL10m-like [Physella acuta]|uniref:large ribosomal subunit protein uL10m-like n=1 Tax=Physella acuta TaxID=109671 RepID=UPI0027DDA931|nr:large ribosomal subunit protein uL10m-like [Physella acuta]XP_059169494.1 large ribosomal subunit protein uL10m-like [Physella acuta]XP_059169496.1 large ribosomal subunit protein uL10m-like [Physella acuta]
MAFGSRQLIRQFSSTSSLLALPNIQKPRVPWTERRILNAVTVPLLPPDTRPLPVICYAEKLKKEKRKKTKLAEAYHQFKLNEIKKMLNGNKMIAICHLLPSTRRDFFNLRAKFIPVGFNLHIFNNYWAKEAIENSKFQNLNLYMTSNTAYITSEENRVVDVVGILRKTEGIHLLGGLVEGRILSRDGMMDLTKLPPLDVLRGELVTILASAAAKTSSVLGQHQQELAINLGQLAKQKQEGSDTPPASTTEDNQEQT